MIFKKVSVKLFVALFVIAATIGVLASCNLFHEHSFGDAWEIVQAATCTEVGVKTKTCECGEIQSEDIPIIPHSWVDATCTAPKSCSACAATEGEALGHTWAEATCTEPKTCTVCAATEGEALSHTWAEATCTEPKTCTVCGATEGEITDHSIVAGICNVCGYEDPIYKERKIGAAIFGELISVGATTEKIANYIEDAWYFYIYEAKDKIGASSDGMAIFAKATGLSKANVEKATIEYLTILGYAEDEMVTTYKNAVFWTLSGCVYVATRSCELMGLNDGVEASLDDIKSQLKTMSDEYEKETGLSILKDMYSNVSNYYEYVMSPSGNYNQFNDKVDNYTEKIVDNFDDLSFIYD